LVAHRQQARKRIKEVAVFDPTGSSIAVSVEFPVPGDQLGEYQANASTWEELRRTPKSRSAFSRSWFASLKGASGPRQLETGQDPGRRSAIPVPQRARAKLGQFRREVRDRPQLLKHSQD
jgi:hypothetical protein